MNKCQRNHIKETLSLIKVRLYKEYNLTFTKFCQFYAFFLMTLNQWLFLCIKESFHWVFSCKVFQKVLLNLCNTTRFDTHLPTHKAGKKTIGKTISVTVTLYEYTCTSHMYRNWLKNWINFHKAPSSKLCTTPPYLLHRFPSLIWVTPLEKKEHASLLKNLKTGFINKFFVILQYICTHSWIKKENMHSP